MTETSAPTPAELTARAQALAAKGDAGASRKLLERALTRDPEHEPAYSLLARQCLVLGDLEAAYGYATLGLRRFPKNAACWEARALVCLALLNRQEAERDVDTALRLDPALIEARVCKASLLLARRQPAPALDVLAPARELAPDAPAVYLTLGAAYQMKHDLDRARTCFVRAGELQPLDWRVYQALAGLDLEQESWEGGLGHADLALKLGGDTADVHRTRGLFLAKLGRLDEARTEFETVTRRNPGDASGWLFLAEAEAAVPSEQAAARRHARHIIESFPGTNPARAAERILQRLGPPGA